VGCSTVDHPPSLVETLASMDVNALSDLEKEVSATETLADGIVSAVFKARSPTVPPLVEVLAKIDVNAIHKATPGSSATDSALADDVPWAVLNAALGEINLAPRLGSAQDETSKDKLAACEAIGVPSLV
jgi:hypothetical protein